MKQRVSFYTFGCRLNQSETAVIQNSLEANGYAVVDFEQPSDIVVVNTCTVTEGGDADTRRLVQKVSQQQPNARIALVGCQAQVQREALASLPNVSWVIGNQRKMELVKVFKEYPVAPKAHVITPTIERAPFVQLESAIDRDHTRANIKIQDGCDFFCSFCEIPYARGRARSRVFDDIIREARQLAISKHQEIVLTGINVGTYHYEGKTLLDVVKSLSAIEQVKRIRISSIEPTTVPEELLSMMGDKLCRYLHLPLQSGDDGVLALMKRKYTLDQYADFIKRAKSQVKEICVGTDIIVGFPGETESQFEQTLCAVRDLPIDYVHVFSYSPRSLAQSRKEQDVVSSSDIAKRSQALRDLSLRKRGMYFQSLLGTRQTVLLEQPKQGVWSGLTDHYVRVKMRKPAKVPNVLVPVKLVDIDGVSMIGEIDE